MDTPYIQAKMAIDRGDRENVRNVVRENMAIIKKNGWLLRLLDHAARNNKVDMVSLLAELGVDVNEPFNAGEPEGVINNAAGFGARDSVAWLLDHGAKVNFEVRGEKRCFPLSGAIMGGYLDIVKLLVERGNADIHAAWGGMNALTFAVQYGQKEIETYLRSKGAVLPDDVQIVDASPAANTLMEHIKKHLGKPKPLALREIVPGNPSIAINVVPMGEALALVTTGMSDQAMKVKKGDEDFSFAELVLYLPANWKLTAKALADQKNYWPIEWMRRIAHFPHENKKSLGRTSFVIANGKPPKPLGPNTQMTCWLGLTQESEFGRVSLPDGKNIVFYTLIPIHTEERDLEKRKGAIELVRLFEKHGISQVLDVKRMNVGLGGADFAAT